MTEFFLPQRKVPTWPRVLAVLLCILMVPACALARLPAPKHAQWESPVLGKTLKLTILEPGDFRSGKSLPMIIYLEHLAVPRVGTDSDRAIVRDFRDQGYLVVILNYARNPRARVPFINRDIYQLRDDLFHGRFLPGLKLIPRTFSSCPPATASCAMSSSTTTRAGHWAWTLSIHRIRKSRSVRSLNFPATT